MKKLLLLTMFFMHSFAFADTQNLISYKGDKVGPLLAKTGTKVSDTSYRFVLDTTKKVDGKPITADIVKKSLESQLGKKMQVTATIEKPDTLLVKFKGSEKAFLATVSRTKISATQSLAMESTVADTGIRAKTGADAIADDEIKLKILKSSPESVSGLVMGMGKNFEKHFKKGRKVTFDGDGTPYKKGQTVNIKLVKDGDSWRLP